MNFTFTKPKEIIINGQSITLEKHSWHELYTSTCKFLYSKHKQEMLELIINDKVNTKKKIHFSNTEKAFINPSKIADRLYVETCLSADRACSMTQKLLKIFGYNEYSITSEKKSKSLNQEVNYVNTK